MDFLITLPQAYVRLIADKPTRNLLGSYGLVTCSSPTFDAPWGY